MYLMGIASRWGQTLMRTEAPIASLLPQQATMTAAKISPAGTSLRYFRIKPQNYNKMKANMTQKMPGTMV
jgi:hypothetical protein